MAAARKLVTSDTERSILKAMRISILLLLALSALAAEPPKPKPTPEQARILELERKLALEETRSAYARMLVPQAEFEKAHAKACGVFGIPIAVCRWNGNTLVQVPPPAEPPKPKPAKVETEAK